ncbi:MAG: nitroreductase family protein [Oscillospiraceae bacterium]|jgi:nitroreductase|nr:nitroreductase family protein [Oscillospiraceae bacterium]
MNAVLDVIAKRYSCRGYTDAKLTDEQLGQLAAAAVAAPSGMNRQGWRIIVIKDKAVIDEMDAEGMRILSAAADKSGYERIMSRGGKLYYNAPCMIIVAIDEPGSALDCGIVCENIALAASSMGLGNVICGMAGIPLSGEKEAYFKEKMKFPQGFGFGCAVLVGHAAQDGTPHEPDMSKVSYI